MQLQKNSFPTAQLQIIKQESFLLHISLHGTLSIKTLSTLWKDTIALLSNKKKTTLVLDCANVLEIDGIGAAYIDFCREMIEKNNGVFSLIGCLPQIEKRLKIFYDSSKKEKKILKNSFEKGCFEDIGLCLCSILNDTRSIISFAGELTIKMFKCFFNPLRFRWNDFFYVFETAGVNALPLILMIGFLVGVIMAFQSAIPMRQFGADIFVANLVSLSMLRELAPLMTAIILAGRSGSAFAAEIGTMQVNEEINALHTMGIDPLRFLVVSRVAAVCFLMPVLTLFADFAGIVGGGVVMRSFGYSFATYLNQIVQTAGLSDLSGGLVKAFVFGLLISAIGCLRGLETKTGAQAVGVSATRSVVSGIVLIVLFDGLFAVLFYYLGV